LEQSFTAQMSLLKATSSFILGQRCYGSAPWCYLHHLHAVVGMIKTVTKNNR